QFLNKADVSPVISQVGAEGVPQQVRRNAFFNTSKFCDRFEKPRNVATLKTLWVITIRYKHGRVAVPPQSKIFIDPLKGFITKEYRKGLCALADNLRFLCLLIDRIAIQ